MIILTSNGISSEKLARDISPYTEGLTSSVIITTASVGYKRNDWHIPSITEELKRLGLSVDYFDFDEDDPGILLESVPINLTPPKK